MEMLTTWTGMEIGDAENMDRDRDAEYVNREDQGKALITLFHTEDPRKIEFILAKMKELEIYLKNLRSTWNEIT